MATNHQLLEVVRGELGQTSGAKYWSYVFPSWAFRDGSSTPWCACFVSWAFAQVGQAFPGLPSGYVPAILNACKSAGVMLDDVSTAQPGDVVFFDWDGGLADHIGFVERNALSELVTIEGNTSGSKVARRSRAWSSVIGIARPAWDGSYARDLLEVDGWWGPKTTKALQGAFGTPQDGIVSSQDVTYRNDGTLAASSGGWEFVAKPQGSLMVQALQRDLGVDVDGIMGPVTIKALERRHGIYPDGRLDGPSLTVMQMQAAINEGSW